MFLTIFFQMFSFTSNIGIFGKTLILIFLTIACFLFGYFLAAIIGIPLFGINIFSQQTAPTDNIAYLKFLQSILSIFMFIIPTIVYWLIFGKNISKDLKLNVIPKYKTILLSLLVLIVSLPLINFLSNINSQMDLPDCLSQLETWMKQTEEANAELTNKFLNVDGLNNLIINILIMAMIPAIGEEFFFRGCMQNIFSSKNSNIFAVWATAFFFSAFHLQFYGFLPRFVLGAFFGWLTVWSKSLWLPIISHFFNNFCAIIGVYLINHNNISASIDTVGSNSTWPAALASLVVCIFLVIKIKKIETKNA